jgi:hypothetical protein
LKKLRNHCSIPHAWRVNAKPMEPSADFAAISNDPGDPQQIPAGAGPAAGYDRRRRTLDTRPFQAIGR